MQTQKVNAATHSVSGAASGRLARSSIAAFGIYAAGAGLTYCSQLAIARSIGANAYGIYATVFACMTVLAYLSALGFDVSLLRLIPAYRARGAWKLLRGVVQYAQRRAVAMGLLVAILGIAIVEANSGRLSPEFRQTFLVGFILVPIWALLWVRSSVVRAFGGVISALAPDRLVRDGLLVGFIGIAIVTRRHGIDAPFAMLATVLSSAIGLGLVSLAAHQRQPRNLRTVLPEQEASLWRRTALPLVMIAVAEAGMNRTGVFLLGWAGYTKEAGIYALVFNITVLVALPRTAVNALFAPMVSDLFVHNDRVGLQHLVTKAAIWTLLGAICIALPLWLFPEHLLAWFGRDFAAGVPTMRILLLGQVAAAAAGSQLFLMTMTGNERAASVLFVSTAVLNAVASAVLIGLFGPNGAAVAASAALILWNAAMALFIWKKLRLIPGVLAMAQASARGEANRPAWRGLRTAGLVRRLSAK